MEKSRSDLATHREESKRPGLAGYLRLQLTIARRNGLDGVSLDLWRPGTMGAGPVTKNIFLNRRGSPSREGTCLNTKERLRNPGGASGLVSCFTLTVVSGNTHSSQKTCIRD